MRLKWPPKAAEKATTVPASPRSIAKGKGGRLGSIPRGKFLLLGGVFLLGVGYVFLRSLSGPEQAQGFFPPPPSQGQEPGILLPPPDPSPKELRASASPFSPPPQGASHGGSGLEVRVPPLPVASPSQTPPEDTSLRDPFAYPEEKTAGPEKKTAGAQGETPSVRPAPLPPLPPVPPSLTAAPPPTLPAASKAAASKAKEDTPSAPPPPPPPLGVVYGERGYPAVLLFPLGEGEVVEVIVGSDSWSGYRFYLEGNKVMARSVQSGGESFYLAPLPKGGYAWLPVKPKGGGR